MERGVDFLDKIFAGESAPKTSAGTEPTVAPDPAYEPADQEPEPSTSTEPTEPAADTPTEPVSTQEPSTQDKEPEQQQPQQTTAPAAPSGVRPSHTDVTLFSSGESFKYQPKGVSGTYACTYASKDESVATVDANGNVTAVGKGTTTVTMHVEYNGQYDFECIIRCNWKEEASQPSGETSEPVLPGETPATDTPAATVAPSHLDATFFGPGESFQYLPLGIDGVYACTYSSDDASVASVDSSTGKVTAVGPGTTKIRMHVEWNGQYDFECIVRCSWTDSE